MTNKEKEIFTKALTTYGYNAQEMMCIEECAELTNAIAKLHRGRVNFADIITELADVSIMVDQLAIYYGKNKFDKERKRKIKRLEERLTK